MCPTNQDDEKIPTKAVSGYIPEPFHERIMEIIRREGFLNISDFIRSASRREVQYYETKYYSQVLSWLLSNGRITPKDVQEALHDITVDKFGETY